MLGMDSIRITPETLRSACEVDEFKGLWRALERHTSGLNMLGDVAGHGAEFRKILGPLQDQAITTNMIRILHSLQTGDKGMSPYRLAPKPMEIAGAGEIETAAPEQIEKLMAKLVEWVNKALVDDKQHPLITIAGFMGVFLQIGPFEESNLKTACFLVLLLMLKSGYGYAPFQPIDKIVFDGGGMVLRALRHNQDSLEVGSPDWSLWMRCFFQILKNQKDGLEGRIFSREKDMAHLPTLSGKILKLFDDHQRLQMSQIVKFTRGRRSTIKLRLGELVDGGYLRRYGQARSTWYSLG